MSSLARVLVTALAGLVACADPNAPAGTDITVPVDWMEWPAGVTLGEHGSIRLVGFWGACGTLMLTARDAGNAILAIDVVQHIPQNQPCPLERISSFIGTYDTVIPLPRLTPTESGGAYYTIEADARDLLTGIRRRGFGSILLTTGQLDVTTQAAGQAFVRPDSLGCSWVRAQVPYPPPIWVLKDTLPFADGWYDAFVSGQVVPTATPRCGTTQLFQARLLEVNGL